MHGCAGVVEDPGLQVGAVGGEVFFAAFGEGGVASAFWWGGLDMVVCVGREGGREGV